MNILFLTHRVPYAPNRGDRIRAFHLLREMADVGHVSLFTLVHDDEEEAQLASVPHASRVVGVRVKRLRSLMAGAAALPTSRPLTHSLLDAPDARRALRELVAADPPDVVVAFCTGMARFALEPPLAGVPFVLDMVDVDSVKWAELAAVTTGPKGWLYQREAATLATFEAEAARAAQTTMVVNERERDALAAIAPDACVEVVPNGIDIEAFAPAAASVEAPIVTFCGVMDYAPNVEGVRWFVRRVWPLVRSARPDAALSIVGSRPTPDVRRFAADDASIEVTGAVPVVQPYLWRSAVSVAPLALARGLQNKVLEALAARVPVVATPQVMAGLPPKTRPGCLEAEAPGDFARAVVDVLNLSPSARKRLAGEAVLDGLGWPERLAPLRRILTERAGHQEARPA